MMENNEENWSVECSDDEKYEFNKKNEWIPKPDDLLALIDEMENNNRVLKLEWKCPGKRAPSPVTTINNHQENPTMEFKPPKENSDFDFMDEMSSPRQPVRRIGESTPKGSAKKKTATFNGVLTTMLRHRRLEQEIGSSPKKSEPGSPSMKS
ncbi:hypothetical protein TKK_0014064 [Trichogramma kaykai]